MTARPGRLGVPLFAGAVVFALSLADGGFFSWTWPWTMLALVAAAAGVWLLAGGTRVSRLEVAFVAGLAALAAWQALSAEWSLDPSRSLDDAYRGTVYVAAAAAFAVLARAAGPRALLVGIAGGVTVTLVEGFVEYAREDVRDPFEGDLLFQPLGYANAVGILAAMALILALGLFAERPRRAARAALAATMCVSAAALVLTESRGAWVAAAAGLVTLAVFRRRLLVPWLAVVALLVVLVLVSPLVVEQGRLSSLLSDRAYYWPVAWHSLDSPIHGLGSGSFATVWALEQPIPRNAIDAHSLLLETLLELGVVGLVVLATLALPFAAARTLGSGWAAAATGAYTAFLVHASVDWDWEMPAVTIAGLACGAALLAGRATRTMGP